MADDSAAPIPPPLPAAAVARVPLTAVTTLETNKGKPLKVVDGRTYVFHYHNANTFTAYWRCSKFKKCPVRFRIVPGDDHLIFAVGAGPSEHTHAADPVSPKKRERVSELKAAACANITTTTRSLASNAHSGLTEAELARFPSERSLQQTAYNKRKVEVGSGADKEPSNVELPGMLTVTELGEPFLLYDSRKDNAELPVILAFGAEHGAQMLESNRKWALDGTFFASALHWDSLLTVNAIVDNSALPALWILMPDKHQVTYERALAGCFKAGAFKDVAPTSFLCDYELSMKNAMKKQFPAADCQYCYFHLAKAAWAQIQKKGLLPVYDRPEVQVLLRSYPALAFLPVAEVGEGLNEIDAALSRLVRDGVIERRFVQPLNKYSKYFNKTYVGNPVGARRVQPRFQPAEWSVHERTLNGEPRWHNALNRLFPRAKPPLSQFIVRMKKEDERTRALITRHNVRPAEHVRGRPSAVSSREKNINVLVNAYADMHAGERNRLEFLRKVQYHLSPVAFERMLHLSETGDEDDEPTSSQASYHGILIRDDEEHDEKFFGFEEIPETQPPSLPQHSPSQPSTSASLPTKGFSKAKRALKRLPLYSPVSKRTRHVAGFNYNIYSPPL